MKVFILTLLVSLLLMTTYGQDEESPECTLECPDGFLVDKEGNELCECYNTLCDGIDCPGSTICKVFTITQSKHRVKRCVDPHMPPKCQSPMDPGPCKAAMPRFYYNSKNRVCTAFQYGGCDGNENNYNSFHDCEVACKPEVFHTLPGCPDITCVKTCASGFNTDTNGCFMCECLGEQEEEDKPSLLEKSLCPDDPLPRCMMNCEYGFKLDYRGCQLCECEEECPPLAECELDCEERKRDIYGCDTCECAFVCPELTCAMYCEFGMMKDANGCSVCKCILDPSCPDPDCDDECDFGNQLDDSGCPSCECLPHPCELSLCQSDKPVCQAYQTRMGTWKSRCVRNTGCPLEMCEMHCEFGFQSDVYGCEACACREESAECPPRDCNQYCQYGFEYNTDGCSSCRCVRDPCKNLTCSEEQVCEASQPSVCPTCPAKNRCIAKHEVKRIRVTLIYLHDPLEEVDIEEFESALKRRLASLLNVETSSIHGLKIVHTNNLISVRFHVVYGNAELVNSWHKVERMLREGHEDTHVYQDQIRCEPDYASVHARFSSNPEYYEDEWDAREEEEEDRMTSLIIIIACACAGGVIIIVLVIVSVAIMKRRGEKRKKSKKTTKSSHKNVIYKKTATTENKSKAYV